MTSRDRLVVSVLAAVALLAAVWFLAVSPKKKEAADAGSALGAAQAMLAQAQQEVAQARSAATGYAQNLRLVREAYRAVPATDAVNRLLPTLQRTSNQSHVDFRVLSTALPGGAGPAGAAPAANAQSGSFTPLPFTFTFNGGYRLLQGFLHDLDRFVVVGTDGRVVARNRLLVVSSVALKPQSPGHGFAQATITASAYTQPAASAAPPAVAQGAPR